MKKQTTADKYGIKYAGIAKVVFCKDLDNELLAETEIAYKSLAAAEKMANKLAREGRNISLCALVWEGEEVTWRELAAC